MASEGTQVLRSYVVKVCEGSFLHTRGSFLVHALMTFLLFFFFISVHYPLLRTFYLRLSLNRRYLRGMEVKLAR